MLIAVVGVDVEAEDCVDFYRLSAAHGGAELPMRQRGHDLRCHVGRARFEDLEILQLAGSIECAFDDDAGVGKAGGQIGEVASWAGEGFGLSMRGGINLGELHHDRADRSIHIDRVVVAWELAVEIKHSAGARGSDDGDGRPLVRPCRRVVGRIGSAAVRSEAGQIDDAAAAATNVDTGHGGRSCGSATGAAGAGRGRDSVMDILIGIGPYTGSSLARA
jgi:hypothetical protein